MTALQHGPAAGPDRTSAGHVQPPVRVLLITQWYWPELIGTGFYSADLAEWLAGRGSRVTVITNRPSYPGPAVFPAYRTGERDREEVNGVAIERLPTSVARSGGVRHRLAAELHFLLRAGFELLRRGREEGAAVVSFCPSMLAVLAASLARGRRSRHVAIVHDIQSGLAQSLGLSQSGIVNRMIRATERFCLNRADQLVVLSEEMRAVLQELGVVRPIMVVPIWVDTARVRPLPRAAGAPPTVLYSGNFGRKQGLDQVLDCAEILSAALPEARVVLRGGGSLEGELRAEAQRRKLPNLSFEPLLPLERLGEALAQADILLVPQEPSASEFAVPSKIYTIMAAGRPMVATAREGSPLWKLAQASGAILCAPPRDPERFAAAVLELLRDPERRAAMGMAARRFAVKEVDREHVLLTLAGVLAGNASGHVDDLVPSRAARGRTLS